MCEHLRCRVAHAGSEGRETRPALVRPVSVVSTSSLTQGWKAGLLARVSGHHVVRGRRSSLILQCAQVTGKTGKNGQISGDGAARSSWRRPSVPGRGDSSKASARSCSIWGDDPGEHDPGVGIAVDWVTGRSCSDEGDGSMYRQACVRAG